MSITLQRIVAPSDADIAALHELCLGTPAYWRLCEGKAPGRDQIAGWFAGQDLPEGLSLADDYFFMLWAENRPVGLCQVLRGWPYRSRCMIGLMLIVEEWQGLGLGRLAYREVERLIADWPGSQTVWIGVAANNEPALSFWRSLGFRETGERRRDPKFLAETILFEKALA